MFGPSLATRTVPAALRDLADPRASVRAAAARDLASAPDGERERAAGALVSALRDVSLDVRTASAEALATLAPANALEALVTTAQEDEEPVRQRALMALGELRDERALPAIERGLRDASPAIRFQSLIAIARTAPRERAIAALLDGTEDADPLVCHIALRMAEELGDAGGAVDPAVHRRARPLLRHPDPVVRVAAAIVRSRGGARDGIPLLLEVVRGELVTSQAEDEAAAIELVGELGLTRACHALRKRTGRGLLGWGGDRFAWQARVALARLGDADAQAWILRELGAWSRDRRTLAVAAAGRARLATARPLLEAMRGDPDRAEPDAVEEALRALSGA